MAAGLAIQQDAPIFDDRVCFWVLALLAEDKLGDVAMQIVLELRCLMGTVDDPAVVGWIGIGLGPKLESEIFDDLLNDVSMIVSVLASYRTHELVAGSKNEQRCLG